MRVPLLLLVLASAALTMVVPGCARGVWQSRFERNHPLVGRIWDVAGARFVDSGAVIRRAAGSRFVLLGEKHDNPDHHRLQAQVVQGLIAAGRRPAVAFEMFTADQAPVIARQVAAAPHDAPGIARAVHWETSGWPDFSMYRPIVEAALETGLPIVAANLPSATAREAGRKGIEALDRGLVARHGLDHPLAPDVDAAMAAEIQESHCGQAPPAIIPKMVLVQRARDARMADALVDSGTRDGAILITGDGHARNDRGVPAALGRRDATASITSVAFLEVQESLTSPPGYARDFGDRGLPYDYVWFTPRVDKNDPCVEFKESLEKLRQRK